MTRAATIAMSEDREDLGVVGVGDDMAFFLLLRGTGL